MAISFEANLSEVEGLTVIKLPINSSRQLTSRGMVMVKGTINKVGFKAPLEPDGKGSHWLEISADLRKEIGKNMGDVLALRIEQTNEWIEPDIPGDILSAITDQEVLTQWNALTPKSRWEWLRWIRSTLNPVTRNKRIHVACSKLQQGDENPCCFDTTRCTVPEVSKSGVLLD